MVVNLPLFTDNSDESLNWCFTNLQAVLLSTVLPLVTISILYILRTERCESFIHYQLLLTVYRFLADRTNGRAYATVLRLSVAAVVCRRLYGMYCG